MNGAFVTKALIARGCHRDSRKSLQAGGCAAGAAGLGMQPTLFPSSIAYEEHITHDSQFDPEVFYYFLLPPILLNAGYTMNTVLFFRYVWLCLPVTYFTSLLTRSLLQIYGAYNDVCDSWHPPIGRGDGGAYLCLLAHPFHRHSLVVPPVHAFRCTRMQHARLDPNDCAL